MLTDLGMTPRRAAYARPRPDRPDLPIFQIEEFYEHQGQAVVRPSKVDQRRLTTTNDA